MWKTRFTVMLVLIAALALGDDLKTISGKEYKRVKVSRVEPDGIVITHKTGVTKLLFSELPTEVQKQFGYVPAKIEAESAAAGTGEEKGTCHFCFQFFSRLDFSRLGARACVGLHQRSC
jgi:hypothetical protein